MFLSGAQIGNEPKTVKQRATGALSGINWLFSIRPFLYMFAQQLVRYCIRVVGKKKLLLLLSRVLGLSLALETIPSSGIRMGFLFPTKL